jgi:sorting nexin-8
VSSRMNTVSPYHSTVKIVVSMVRSRLSTLIEHWQRICLITERLIKRRESASADLARLTMTLNVLVEGSTACWRGAECELCTGVQGGLKTCAVHTQIASDIVEQRVCAFCE